MSLIDISGLSLDIGGTEILRDVSLEVPQSAVTALVGESGSGKSMTALSVMGLLPEAARARGSVRLAGRELLSLPEPAMCAIRGNEIGMIFQEPMTALNPVQTIGAQVAETLRIHGVESRSEAMTIARQRLDRVGLAADRFPLDRYPHELSGGQRQRVCIAMAIARRPKLLIADEPTTALDVTTQAQILALLRGLVRDEGMALLLITHDLAVVSGMAQRVAVMKDGRIVEDGATRTLLRAPGHPYTQSLIEASTRHPDRAPGTSGKVLLQVRDVVRDYTTPRKGLFGARGSFRAVDGVSFDLHAGESLGLVGESGCGKSTLTRALLGLEPVQGGRILLEGREVKAPRVPNELRRRMQVVFQDPFGSFNPRHRVGRLVAEPFHLMRVERAERVARVADALEQVGLHPEDSARFIHEFSGGQRQRIAIARAIVTRPDLVILDEAVSALDVRVRAQILDLLARLQGQYGLSYLFIGHDLSVVRQVTDRVLVMRDGRIVEQGETERVFAAPSDDYTRALVAATPVLDPGAAA